jgi:hypothetical protein
VAIFLLVEAEKEYGPRLVRPYVMPAIARINAALGCGARRGPKPFVVRPRDALKPPAAAVSAVSAVSAEGAEGAAAFDVALSVGTVH